MKGRFFLLPTLQGYRRAWLAADVVAGLTLVAIAIPEQMATAHLANLAPMAGFDAFIAGSVLFALFGRHPVLSVGADSTIAPVFAAGVATLAAAGSPRYASLVSATALLAGGALVAGGLLRLGWVADFLPQPVVSGLLAGIGTEILVKQVPTVLGLPGGGTTTIGRLEQVSRQIGQWNGWSVGIAAGVLALVVAGEKVDRRLPGALLGVVGATALVATAGLSRHLAVVGPVKAALPYFGLPSASLGQLGQLVATAATVTFLCLAQTSATLRSTSPAGGHAMRAGGVGAAAAVPRTEQPGPGDFDVDLIALGLGSVAAGLAGTFPVNSSPPRTAVVASAGGRSQVASLTAVAAVMAVAAWATGLLEDLPEAALGAVLVFVATRLFHFSELARIFRFSTFEFALAVFTWAIVVLVGIEQGLVAAALVALAQRGRLEARPRYALLGRQVGTDHWVPTDIGRPTEQVPGVLVFLVYAPVWYANAAYVCGRARQAVAQAVPHARALVLDANGIADIDYTGAKAVAGLVAELHASGVDVALARASHLVHHDFKHSGLLQAIGQDRVFDNVEAAVRAVDGEASPRPGTPAA